MNVQKIKIQTEDAFEPQKRLLTPDAVINVSIVTATQVRVKYKPNKATAELIALVAE